MTWAWPSIRRWLERRRLTEAGPLGLEERVPADSGPLARLTAGMGRPGIELESAISLVIEAAVEPLQGLATVLVCLNLMELHGETLPSADPVG